MAKTVLDDSSSRRLSRQFLLAVLLFSWLQVSHGFSVTTATTTTTTTSHRLNTAPIIPSPKATTWHLTSVTSNGRRRRRCHHCRHFNYNHGFITNNKMAMMDEHDRTMMAGLTLTSPILSTTFTTSWSSLAAVTSSSSMMLSSINSIANNINNNNNNNNSPFHLLALLASDDPLMAAEVCSDAAHLALDFIHVLGPATVVVRLAAVIGRILTIASDYVPDHAMFPEEFVFQMSMLVISISLLIKSAAPLILPHLLLLLNNHSRLLSILNNSSRDDNKNESSTAATFQDRRAYCVLLGPHGITWQQYQTMITTRAVDWMDVEPHQMIVSDESNIPSSSTSSTTTATTTSSSTTSTSSGDQKGGGDDDDKGDNQHDDCMFWLYSGNVQVTRQGKVVQTIQRSKSSSIAATAALLREMKFITTLEQPHRRYHHNHRHHRLSTKAIEALFSSLFASTTRTKLPSAPPIVASTVLPSSSQQQQQLEQQPSSSSSSSLSSCNTSMLQTTLVAGSQGAKLLRIHTRQLRSLMDNDEHLAKAIRSLMVQSLQDKLSSLLQHV